MNTRDVLAGAGVGAALAFILDPQGGGRRRALARDKARRATRNVRARLDGTIRDLAHRTRGATASARRRFSHEPVDDARLVERVRTKLGRVCSHPRAIDVEAHDGQITLRGPILTRELDDVLAAAAAVHGVTAVRNELESHGSAGRIPSLQGEGWVAPGSLGLQQLVWAPATRALVSASVLATGLCVAAYARRKARAA